MFMRGRNYQPRILCPVKIFFSNAGEIKIFGDEGKGRKFVANRPTPKRMAKANSLNQIETIKERTLEHYEGNLLSKSIGKYNYYVSS